MKKYLIKFKDLSKKIFSIILAALVAFKKDAPGIMKRAFEDCFGKWSVTPPLWISKVLPFFKNVYAKSLLFYKQRTKKQKIAFASILVLSSGLYYYIKSLPKPDYVEIKVEAPADPYYYSGANAQIPPLRLVFSKSAAQMTQISKAFKTGISLSPEVQGEWIWQNDTTLVFNPSGTKIEKGSWDAGQEYEVTFERGFFPRHLSFKSRTLTFKASPMKASVSQNAFYQDPKDAQNKRATFQLRFSYAPDLEDLKKRIQLQLVEKEGLMGIKAKKDQLFSISQGEFANVVEIVSDVVGIPSQDSEMNLTLEKGYRAASGKASDLDLSAKVDIPGMFTYFRIEKEELNFARNLEYEPEQVLIVETRAELSSDVLGKSLKLSLLPVKNPDVSEPKKKKHIWTSASEVTPKVRSQLQKINFEVVPSPEDVSKIHSFKVNVPAGRYLLLEIPKGLKSFGGYSLAEDYASVAVVPEFPRELMIMSEGAILSYSGERKVPLLARNLSTIQFELMRILPEQLNQFVVNSFRYGTDFRHPDFSFLSEDTMSERFVEKKTLTIKNPKDTQYFSFDLGSYLEKSPNRKGVFYLRAKSEKPYGYQDQRMVMVTDLGILSKRNADRSYDVFIQNLKNGSGVAGASIEVIGSNGIQIINTQSDESGRAHIPDLNEFKNEKYPVAIIARKGNDLAFIPIGMESRKLDYSKFDIGGLYESYDSDRLFAYLFSDRGIYRPGESVNMGMLLRSRNWVKGFDNIPVTWSVVNPQGVELLRKLIKVSHTDFVDLQWSTNEVAPTGTYNVNVFVEGKNKSLQLIGSQSVRVEEFMPDTLRISSALDGQKTNGWISATGLSSLKASVSLQNLFGTAAENRVVRGDMTFIPAQPSFSEYKDYSFINFQNEERTFSETLTETRTDQAGHAEFNLDISRFKSPLFWIRFEAEGYESEGGRSVMSASQSLVSALPYLVGYKKDSDLSYLKRESEHRIEFISIDSSLKKVAAQDLDLRLIEKKYVSVLMKQSNGLYKYQSVLKEIPKNNQKWSIAAQGTQLKIPTTDAGDFVYVVKSSQGIELNRVDFSVVGDANQNRSLEKNAELQLTLNKNDFDPGEEIEMQIKAPYTGSGLITIEREKVFTSKWFQSSTTSTIQRIAIPSGLEGNAYVTVTFLRASDSKEIFMSPLSYAVRPFSLSLDRKKINLSVSVPKRTKPGQKLEIKYSANRDSKAILYGVDDGILQVAKYKKPDPLAFFFQRRALQVSTFQLLDLLLPEYSLFQTLAASGGDEGAALGKNLNPFKRKNQAPVVFWSGVVNVGPEAKTFQYTVPDSFNGNIKVMLVSATSDSFGSTSEDALIRGDIILNPSVPPFVAGGDEFDVSVGVFNQTEGSGAQAKVSVNVVADPSLELVNKGAQELAIPENRESSVSFRFKAKSSFGAKKIQFKANLLQGTQEAKYSSEISVRPAGPYLVNFSGGMMSSKEMESTVDGNLISELRKTEAGLSSSPLILVKGVKSQFENYPYLCTEQLLSNAMGFLFYKTLGDLGYNLEEAKKSFDSTLQLLRARQKPNGAISLYPGSNEDSVASLHAALYLTLAKEKMFAVPQEIIDRLLSYLQSNAFKRFSTPEELRNFSMSLYLLARNGIVKAKDLADFVKMTKSNEAFTTSNIGSVYLAATQKLYQMEAEGMATLKKFKLEKSEATADTYYYSALTLDAIFFWLVSNHFSSEVAKYWNETVQQRMLLPIQSGQISTYAAAYVLAAFESMATKGEASMDSRSIVAVLANGEKASLQLPNKNIAFSSFAPDAKKLLYSVGALPSFFYKLESGFEKSAPTQEIKKGLELTREYLDNSGNPAQKIRLGETLTVRLRGRALEKDLYHVAVVDLFPGAFEAQIDVASQSNNDNEGASEGEYEGEGEGGSYEGEESFEGEEGAGIYQLPLPKSLMNSLFPMAYAQTQTTSTPLPSFASQFIDRREDRVVIYTTMTSELREFVYKIKATNKGSFIVPSPFAQGMYDKNIMYRRLQNQIVVE